MKTLLAETRLKSGESLRVSCVLGPEPAEAPRIVPLLGHKGGVWNWHVEKSLTETLDSLENRYYIGEIGGRIVGNICTFEQDGVGILGHVFTTEDQRRKGIASALLQTLMDDFRRRGGQMLSLGTGFDSPAYHIYRNFGFRSIAPGSGDMRYDALPEAPLAPDAAVTVREAQWGDWARLNLLLMRPGEPVLRNLACGWFGPSNVEWGFLNLWESREKGKGHRAWVMETSVHLPLGFATLTPARLWPGPVWLLDLHLRPDCARHAPAFLNALPLPEGKVQAHTEASDTERARAFTDAGWRQEGLLKDQLPSETGPRDILLWGRR